MHTYKRITMPVLAKAEHKRNELFMEVKRFVEFARALHLQCDQDLLETYERQKVLFPYARVVRPRRLEERIHWYRISHEMRPYQMLTRSKEYRLFIEFSQVQMDTDSGSGFISSSHPDIIDSITKEGHPIFRSLRGEFAPGVVQDPQERPFRSWNTWCFDTPDGFRLNRAEHYYGWWQVLELYELEYVNLQIENPARRFQVNAEAKLLLKGMRWNILHRDINPPTRVDFDTNHEPLNELWPSAWSRWSPWIERVTDFDWRLNASLQCYLWQVQLRGNQEYEWDLHLQRVRVAAKILTEGTCNDEWIQLLRALCRFEEHLAKEDRLLTRMPVHNIIHMTADLLSVAFSKNMRQLAMEHDGPARRLNGLCSVDGETVRPWHLLEILNEEFYISDRFVRPFVEEHFDEWRSRVDPPLEPDCATSFLDRLSTVYAEPLLSALARYQLAERIEKNSPWENQRVWAAVRALIVATESETRRWFESDATLFPFLKSRFHGWQKTYENYCRDYKTREGNCLKQIRGTEAFVRVLTHFENKIEA